MKFKILLFASCAVVIAVGGAYATYSQNELRTILIYYNDDTGNCVQGTIQGPLCEMGVLYPCKAVILEIGGAPREI